MGKKVISVFVRDDGCTTVGRIIPNIVGASIKVNGDLSGIVREIAEL